MNIVLADTVDETSGAATAAAGGGQPSNLGSVVIRGNSILQFELVGR
jgi:small nuclear ribonucleoprotein (snRNP)-like protein